MPNYIQSAAVVMDNATGALLAVVGGRDAEESKLNRAIQSRRQTGSLFKPFIYATFFQQGNSADTRISDDRIAYGEVRGAANWSPRNSDGTYRGMKPASFGLILSRNTMSVRIGNRAGLSQRHPVRPTGGLPREYFPHPGPLPGHVGGLPAGHRQRLQRLRQRRRAPHSVHH